MGWCSATQIFDDVLDNVLDTDLPLDKQQLIVKVLANALEDNDWDCQQDSDYWEHPIVEKVMAELHPSWDWDESESG